MEKKKFEPTPGMVEAAKTVFIAMAWTETVRPIVEGYQKKHLEILQAKNRWTGEVILNPGESYAMPDSDFLIYNQSCKEERDKAGLFVESDDFCPLLVAENMERQAKRALMETMEDIIGIKVDILTGHLKEYKQMIELTLKMLAPYVKINGINNKFSEVMK
jgi:hypothetical protein